MSDIAIHVENLGKLYRVGQFVGYKTIRESLMKKKEIDRKFGKIDDGII